MEPKLTKLANNLRLLTINLPAVQSATLLILVGTGSRYERRDNNGIAHFAEHMFFKGTNKRPTAEAISSTIDGIGGEFNAFTGKEYTGYYVKAASKHLPLVVDVVADMLLNSKFDQEEIDRERSVVLEERRMYLDQPMRHIADVYEELLYGDQPLGWNIVGTPESLPKINHEQFLQYLEDYYKPANMLAIVSGGFEKAEATKLIEESLGQLKDASTKKYLPVKFSQNSPALKIFQKETEQAHFCLGVRGPQLGNPDRYKLSVLNTILGGGMSSRLFLEVRERRGLAYYVRSSTEEYLDTGSFAVQAGVEPKNIEEAIKVVLDELGKIADKKVGEEELSKAKEYIKGKLTLELEDSREVASLFGFQELMERKIRTVETIFTEIDKINASDVSEVAKKLFVNDGLNLAVIGNYKEEKSFRKILKFS